MSFDDGGNHLGEIRFGIKDAYNSSKLLLLCAFFVDRGERTRRKRAEKVQEENRRGTEREKKGHKEYLGELQIDENETIFLVQTDKRLGRRIETLLLCKNCKETLFTKTREVS